MSASADVLAQAKVEVDLAAIPLGKNVCIIPPSVPASTNCYDCDGTDIPTTR